MLAPGRSPQPPGRSGRGAKTDGWPGYPGAAGVTHDPHVVGKMAAYVVLTWVNRIVSNLKVWALGVYHGLRPFPHLAQTCVITSGRHRIAFRPR
jgi:hypothetical protein